MASEAHLSIYDAVVGPILGVRKATSTVMESEERSLSFLDSLLPPGGRMRSRSRTSLPHLLFKELQNAKHKGNVHTTGWKATSLSPSDEQLLPSCRKKKNSFAIGNRSLSFLYRVPTPFKCSQSELLVGM